MTRILVFFGFFLESGDEAAYHRSMFIRETQTVNKKNGNIYRKYSLVESFRTSKGPRQRTIMQLATLKLPKRLWPLLASELERCLAGENAQGELGLPVDEEVLNAVDMAMANYRHQQRCQQDKQKRKEGKNIKAVDLNSASSRIFRSLGAELVGHHFWNELKLGELFAKLGFSERERALAEGVILGRLIKPGSDLATFRWLSNQSSVLELSEANLKKIKKDEVYEITDKILSHKEIIEQSLFCREQELFPERESLYLFDLTNFYFEGSGCNNDLAMHGISKEKRSDCVLVSLALVVDSSGFPVISRVYKVNIGEPTTLSDILCDMNYFQREGQLEFTELKPTLVMDRGIATQENVKLLKEKKLPFIVIERSPREKEYEMLFADYEEKFEQISRPNDKPVWVYKLPEGEKEDNQETVKVLCMSEGRKAKEEAMDKMKWETRATTDLESLIKSVERGYVKNLDKINQRIGRLKERYPGFDKHFKLTLHPESTGKKVERITYKRVDGSEETASNLHGCYVIETTHSERSGPDIWQLYMTLTRVEAAFRSLKTDLKTRPIFHQLASRTEAHLFISIIAYHLLICIEYQLSQHGDKRRWTTIRDVLTQPSHRKL